MKFGFDLFKIDYPASSDLDAIEKNIDNLEEVWGLKNFWNQRWEELKVIKFSEFNIEQLEDAALEFKNKIENLPKDTKKWPVTKNFKEAQVEVFK